MQLKTVYYEKPGGDNNTLQTLTLAAKRAAELGIKTIVIASTTGATAVKALDALKGYKVIIVTHVTGSHDPNEQEFIEENRQTVVNKGGIIITTTHALGGLYRALNPPVPQQSHSSSIGDVVSMALRIFGQGVKVACEIAAMAADAGLVSTDKEIISIGGTGRGADTALVLQPSNVHRFFDLRVKEIICKPRL